MRLKGRVSVAAVKVMRCIAEAAAVPPKGVWRFLGKNDMGMVVGFKGKAGAGRLCVLPYGIRMLPGESCAPALIPLVQPGKMPGGPERSVAALRLFVLFSWVGCRGFYIGRAII
jgi:hypothetical protein